MRGSGFESALTKGGDISLGDSEAFLFLSNDVILSHIVDQKDRIILMLVWEKTFED